MATIHDVAKHSGVSISTVSLVMNYPERVSEATRAKVIRAIKALSYIPTTAARRTKVGEEKKKSVVLISRDVSGPYFYEVMRGISEMLVVSGLELILLSGPDAEQRHFNEMAGNPYVIGILILSIEAPVNCDIEGAIRRGVPVVFVNAAAAYPGAGSVSVDNYNIGEAVAHHFLHIGYRRLAIFGEQTSERASRAAGFVDTLLAGGIRIPPEWNVSVYLDEKNGFSAMSAFLDEKIPLPEAIFCLNDEVARGAIDAMKGRGIHVPGQVAVIGCDDVSVSRYMEPALTTVAIPKFEQGMLSVTQLLRQLNGNPGENIVLNTKLIIRESCGYALRTGKKHRNAEKPDAATPE